MQPREPLIKDFSLLITVLIINQILLTMFRKAHASLETVPCIRVSGIRMAIVRAKAFKSGGMAENMRATGNPIKLMGKEGSYKQMETSMKVNG